ncbi:uncharacterized protein [Onthophagus taurus]|uniref:uncharacterized protein isoform X1 n=1 Tax=Onthophagus taurus TaxID=166361 RepID=UPI0039BE9BCC
MYPVVIPNMNINQPIRTNCDSKIEFFFKWTVYFSRLWGIFSSVVLFGVGMDTAYHHHISGYYLIAASVTLFYLETTWVVTTFLQLSIRNDQDNFLKCWKLMTKLEEWKKTIIYIPLGLIPIFWPHGLWLSYFSGTQIITLAFLHFILSFKHLRCDLRTVNLDPESIESSKYEEILDDVLPIDNQLIFSDNGVQEQDSLLEI